MGVRVGGGQGFYGDTPRSVAGLLDAGIDYLCLEALAELTLAILQKDRQRDETRGYTRDLPAYLGAALPAVAAGRTKLITNAGGINPPAAARAAIDTARQLGLSGLRVATVLGDDLTGRVDTLAGQAELRHLESGAAFERVPRPGPVRVGVPGGPPDRRGARRRRRRRHHRPGRRRRVVPRPARLRARLGVGRLGPPRGGHAGRASPGVLGTERGREPEPGLVDGP